MNKLRKGGANPNCRGHNKLAGRSGANEESTSSASFLIDWGQGTLWGGCEEAVDASLTAVTCITPPSSAN